MRERERRSLRTLRREPHPGRGSAATIARAWQALDRPRVAGGVLAALLSVLAWQCWTAASRWSMTYDEAVHIPAGYIYWRLGDFTFNAEHPPLAKLIATVPLLITAPALPELDGYTGTVGYAFCFEANETRAILLAPRLMIALLGVALVGAVYWWAATLLGRRGGLCAAFLLALEPSFTAHSSLVTTDVPIALFFLVAIACLWALSRRLTAVRVAAFSLAVAAAAITKFNAVLLAPVVLILVTTVVLGRRDLRWSLSGRRVGGAAAPEALRSRRAKASAFAVVLLAVLAVTYGAIWAAYGFSFRGPDRGDRVHALSVPGFLSTWRQRGPVVSPQPYQFIDERRLLPHAYVSGLLHVAVHNARGHLSFLLGDTSTHGWRWYFPLAVLLKTPLPLLLAVVLGAVLLARTRVLAAGEVAFLAVPPLVYLLASMASTLNIGIRHMLPVYPFMAMVAASLVVSVPTLGKRARRYLTVTVALLALWHAFEGLRFRPHFLSYFNQLAGGPANGYRCLSDSNVDWGQDLYLLREWVAENAPDDLKVSYFGPAMPDLDEGIACRYLTPPLLRPDAPNRASLRPGDTVAVSATHLVGMGGVDEAKFRGLRRYRPLARVGYSILVYRLDGASLISP